MSVGRSSAYWSANRYPDPESQPEPTAPVQDLPAQAAARFKAVRSGLLEIPSVVETVRYMGSSWRWTWEYGIGSRKLCWLHLVGNGISTTFTLSDMEESRVRSIPRLSADVAKAVAEAQPATDLTGTDFTRTRPARSLSAWEGVETARAQGPNLAQAFHERAYSKTSGPRPIEPAVRGARRARTSTTWKPNEAVGRSGGIGLCNARSGLCFGARETR